MNKEKEILLFNNTKCICQIYTGENIEIEFNNQLYKNIPTYRPNLDNIPHDLNPEYKECVKNAFYVSKRYNVNVVEGVVVIRDVEVKDAIVQVHCWNFDGTNYFDVTPFLRIPQNITYISYQKDFKWYNYETKFGSNVCNYTFLTGKTILDLENLLKNKLNSHKG